MPWLVIDKTYGGKDMKKRRLVKTLSMVLVLILALSSVGCGKKKSGDGASTNKEAVDDTKKGDSQKEGTEEDKEKASEGTEKTLADFDKVSEFKYFGIAAGVDNDVFNNCEIAKAVKEQTGYNVTYDQAPADPTDAQTAVTNIFMLKSDYQAVKVTKAQFYTLLESDALMDITPYINASTNLKEQIAPFGWETATKDGKIYAIPQKNAVAAQNTAICYRKDWLEEYNKANKDKAIPVPSEENGYSMTLTDFKEMLTYFATKVPQGGKAMAIDTNGVFLENILPAFGIYQEWAEVNGSLEFVVNQPGFEDYMNYMQDLFDTGLVQYQATANDAGAVKSLQARTVGAGRIPHWNAVTVEKSETQETDDAIGYITALIPDDKRGDASAVRAFAVEGYGYYTVIPKYTTKEQAAAVVDFADKKLEKEFFLEMVLGTEGETYKVEDGSYYPVLPTFDEKQGLSDKFMDGTRESEYAQYWLCRTRKTKAQDKMFSRANFNIDNTGIQNPITVMPPCSAYDTYYMAAHTGVKDALVTSLYQTGTSKTVDELKSIWSANFGDDITKAVNEWYGSWDQKDTFNAVKPR